MDVNRTLHAVREGNRGQGTGKPTASPDPRPPTPTRESPPVLSRLRDTKARPPSVGFGDRVPPRILPAPAFSEKTWMCT